MLRLFLASRLSSEKSLFECIASKFFKGPVKDGYIQQEWKEAGKKILLGLSVSCDEVDFNKQLKQKVRRPSRWRWVQSEGNHHQASR